MIRMQTHQYTCTERSNVFCKQRVSKIDHPSPWSISSRAHYQVSEVTSINVQIRLRIFLVKVSYPSRPSRNLRTKFSDKGHFQRNYPSYPSMFSLFCIILISQGLKNALEQPSSFYPLGVEPSDSFFQGGTTSSVKPLEYTFFKSL